MPWFNVDDGFADHPKTVRLQSMEGWQSAMALWLLAGAWASKHLTDGVVPSVMVARLGCSDADAQLLVSAGFWRSAKDGYVFHEWSVRNPLRKDVETKRERAKKRVTEWRGNRVRNALQEAHVQVPSPLLSSPLQDPPVVPHSPARLQALKESVRTEFFARNSPQQTAGDAQWRRACERVQDALDLKLFADAHEACSALAVAAVAAALKPGGKLGFALEQEPFGPKPTPPQPSREDLRPQLRRKGDA